MFLFSTLQWKMWRSSSGMFLLKQSVKSATRFKSSSLLGFKSQVALFSSDSISGTDAGGVGEGGREREKEGERSMSFSEAKKLMRLVNVEALKLKLGTEGKEVIGYSELLEACESMGVAKTNDEAVAFARVLDEAGVILLFRDKVYLHPDKVFHFLFSLSLHII